MPASFVPFFPDNIEGQALLDNFVRSRRILKYRDNDKITSRILRGMPLYETEILEKVGSPAENPNLFLRGDCVSACAFLKDRGIKIDLVYIDPPFASGADYAKKVYFRKNPKIAAAIAAAEENPISFGEGAGGEVALDELKAFEEKMYGDIWNKEDYLTWMHENLMAIKSVMSETASIYVHLDWHIGHYVKILMDEVFGEDRFLNEIIWQRTDPHNDAKNKFGNIHDVIFWYSKNEEIIYNFENTRVNLSESAEKEYSLLELESGEIVNYSGNENLVGRRFKLDDATWKGNANRFEWRGAVPSHNRVWRFPSPEAMDKAVEEGILYLRNPEKGAARSMKSYLDENKGILLQSIWTDAGRMKGGSEYSTQKPEPLLDRILSASSDAGMVVADFFGGSGVTAAVAARLGRRFVHADVGINSIQTARDRLKTQGAAFEVLEIKDGVTLYRNPVQTMQNLHRFIDGLRNDDPLPAFWEGSIHDPKQGKMPVYLPNLLDHTTKVLDVAWMSRIINEAIPALGDEVKKVIVYFVDIEDEAALTRYIAEQNQTLVAIELRDLKPVLEQAIQPDVVEFSIKTTETGGFLIEIEKFLSDRLKTSIENYNLTRQRNLLQKARRNGETEENGGTENGEPVGKNGKFIPLEISENGLELIEMVAVDCQNATGDWHSDAEIKMDKNSFVVRDGKKTKEFWDGTIGCAKKPLRLKLRNIAGDETVVKLTDWEVK